MLNFTTSDKLYELSQKKVTFFDVRSPQEYEENHIPEARNLYLLTNTQRAEVGTLYKQKGPEKALEYVKSESFVTDLKIRFSQYFLNFNLSFSQVSQAIDQVLLCLYVDQGHVKFKLTHEFENKISTAVKNHDDIYLFYCWRGGARSKAVASIFLYLGFNVLVLQGGHKAWRNEVLNYLNSPLYPFKLSVLYGLTGCGKTQLLKSWLAEGKPVIDLEALASHRGSAFGQIGISEIGNQKDFETKLYWQMKKYEVMKAKLVFVEGESKRIGRCLLPDAFMNAMLAGEHIKVEKTLEQRTKLIIEEYIKPVARHEWINQASRSLDVIKKRLGNEKYSELLKDLIDGEDENFVKKLLTDYYDKTYSLSQASQNFYHKVIN